MSGKQSAALKGNELSKPETPEKVNHKNERHIRIPHALIESETWRRLPLSAQALYVRLMARCNSKDGTISESHRQIADLLGCSTNTAAVALTALVSSGLLDRVRIAANRHDSTVWRINYSVSVFETVNTSSVSESHTLNNSSVSKTETSSKILQREDEPLSVIISNTGIGSSRSKTGNSHSPTRSISSKSETVACARSTTSETAVVPDGGTAPEALILSPTEAKKRKTAAKGAAVWEAYSRGYELRYGAAPVRNQKQSIACCQLVERLGASVAPDVAEWYTTSRNRFYTAAMHPLGLLVRDCEQLHTQWLTGVQMTALKAAQDDRLSEQRSVWERQLAKYEEEKQNGQ